MVIDNLPEQLQQRLRGELKPSEALIWASQPIAGRYMRSGFKLWLFFIPWTAFSVYWIAGAAGLGTPDFEEGWIFPLFGLPFVLIGLGGLGSPLWLRYKALSMIYAVTSQRAIEIEGTISITVRSYLARDIGHLERTEHQDGSGDIILWTVPSRDIDRDRQSRRHGFFAVADVRRVARLIEDLKSRT